MQIVWSSKAMLDLNRVIQFLEPKSLRAAQQRRCDIIEGVEQLLSMPRMGALVESLATHEVRRTLIGDYELRYQISLSHIEVLHIWHTREDR